MIKIINWNINYRKGAWAQLSENQADLALIQESPPAPENPNNQFKFGPLPPDTIRPLYKLWPMIVQLSDRIKVDYLEPIHPLAQPNENQTPVSDPSTIAMARITPNNGEPFVVASIYGRWQKPVVKTNWVGCSDISLHRALSDLSSFIGSTDPASHRILIAGDFNIILGATSGSREDIRWMETGRDQVVLDRLKSLGLELVGPRADGGRSSPPGFNPENTPTFYTRSQNPETAERQLDYVFASKGFADDVSAKALNKPEEWGVSDHCQLLIEIT